jgi:hypothetical protein
MSATVRKLDRITRVATFGVRFRDVATHAPVSDGLEVTVFRAGDPANRIRAFRSRGGTFAVQRLPGVRRWDLPDDNHYPRDDDRHLPEDADAFWAKVQEEASPFVVEVRDLLGRFHDFSFRTPLPLRDVYKPFAAAAVASGAPDSVPLFPRCGRVPPPATAVVHAHLMDSASRKPLARALLRVKFGGAEAGLGIADEDGKVAVMFPYPKSARPGPPPALPDLFGWSLDFEVFNGNLPKPDPELTSPLPDLENLLAQRNLLPSKLLGNLAGDPFASQRLSMSRELAVKTADSKLSRLHVLPP